MRTERRTTDFLGVEFANLSYTEVAAELGRLSQSDSFSYVVTPNVDHVVLLHEGQDELVRVRFQEAYKAAVLRLCDSRILELLARFRGTELDVVTGSDLTAFLFSSGQLSGKRVAIVGGDQAMLPDLNERFPDIELLQHIPPMEVLNKPVAVSTIEAFVASSACDYVLFTIGSPQSEIIAHECLAGGRCRGVALCVGASIEFVLRRKARAPVWMQQARLEWAFRLMSEPGRLWRRYLVNGPRIAMIVSRS